MIKPRIHIILIIALLGAGAARSFAQTVAARKDEPKLIAVIQNPNASRKEKVDACRQLAIIGTHDAIAPLAALLGDEELSHNARYALEPIPDPAVDAAFRDALGRLKGKPLVGVIGSVGVRRDAEAVPILANLLQDPDGQVAQAAARALGNVGTPAAATALQEQLPNASGQTRLDICEGLFRCAETAVAQGGKQRAIGIYDALCKVDGPHQVRAGALRGAILTRGKAGLALLRRNLRSNDYVLFSAACQTAMEMPGEAVTRALTDVVNDLPADNQIVVIGALGKRGDAGALPTLFALSKKGEKAVRLQAIQSLPQIGDASAVPVLVGLMGDSDSQISQAAQESLAAIPGRQADDAVLAMLDSGQTEQRLAALELMGRRRMTKDVPALLKAAGSTDEQVRPAAIREVGELGGPEEVPALLDVLMRQNKPQDLDAAENALSAVCRKSDNPQSEAGKLTALLSRAAPAQKVILLRVLGVIGGPQALEAVRAVAKDGNSQVRDAAIHALCTWKTADAAPDLLALVKTSQEPSRRTAALRGYINLIRDESLSTNQKLAMCKQAVELIQRNEDRKLLLGVLGTVPSTEALSMAMAQVNDPATRVEASFAAVAIGEKIVDRNPQEVAAAMQKVLKATKNKNVTRGARQTLQKARKNAGR
jgi:HEAT repeat protein